MRSVPVDSARLDDDDDDDDAGLTQRLPRDHDDDAGVPTDENIAPAHGSHTPTILLLVAAVAFGGAMMLLLTPASAPPRAPVAPVETSSYPAPSAIPLQPSPPPLPIRSPPLPARAPPAPCPILRPPPLPTSPLYSPPLEWPPPIPPPPLPVVERLNRRYTQPSFGRYTTLADVGITLHGIDGFEDGARPWRACDPHDTSSKCDFLADRLSSSMIYRGKNSSFTTQNDAALGTTYQFRRGSRGARTPAPPPLRPPRVSPSKTQHLRLS